MSKRKLKDQDKPWMRKAVARDATKNRTIRNIFLIYCEGANTEPGYFRSFPVNTETEVEALGFGRSRLALVKHILKLVEAKEMLAEQRKYDPERQIWCVFDRDERYFPKEDKDFDAAVALALKNGIRVAWSNDCFELWFYLHDHYIDNKVLRTHYYEYLSGKLKIDYEEDGKAMEFCRSMYDRLADRQHKAIRHAVRLLQIHKDEPRPSRRNPCTTVHELVIELNKCLKR